LTAHNPSALVESFSRLRICVLGDAMLDTYSEGRVSRICPEAPVPVVQLHSRTDVPGGAANAALNAASMGADVTLLSVVGDDFEGAVLRGMLLQHGVNTDGTIEMPGRQTLTKHRVSGEGQILLRMDHGDIALLNDEAESLLISQLRAAWARCDAVVVSDYSYGVLTPRVISALACLQKDEPRVLVVDAKDVALYRAASPTAIKPNYAQAARLLSLHEGSDRAQSIAATGKELLELSGAGLAVVTLDTEGAVVLQRGREPYRIYAQDHERKRTAGAGDTFTTLLALGLAAGAEVAIAAELASAGASAVVSHQLTASVTTDELLVHMAGREKRVHDRAVLQIGLDYERRQGRKIVFTNGCFDILHAGHTAYLNRAKLLGDVLVVAINSDESVRRLKGPTRPINSFEDRAEVIAAMSCVDYIVEFDETTPTKLIELIRPDIFVKGGDYSRATLPEAPLVESLGGRVVILPYIENRSTTSIVHRIQEQAATR
jgi:D-beta-D-heptose 7-phosphate kinase / D-beta-D-heptose 1-phosphate adenosyltransferase